MDCPGSALLPAPPKCGRPSHLSLYSTSPLTPSSTVRTPPNPAATHTRPYLTGCVAEPAGDRALSGRSASSSAMTVAECGSFCFASGFQLFGTEYGSECWCGDAVHGNATAVAAESCAMPCSADALDVCRGSSLLSVYEWY